MKKETGSAIYKLPSSLTNKRYNGNRVEREQNAESEFYPSASIQTLIPAFV